MKSSQEGTKLSEELEIGDHIKVGGWICQIKKAESIFHYTPDNRIRLTLAVKISKAPLIEFIVFFPRGITIELVK